MAACSLMLIDIRHNTAGKSRRLNVVRRELFAVSKFNYRIFFSSSSSSNTTTITTAWTRFPQKYSASQPTVVVEKKLVDTGVTVGGKFFRLPKVINEVTTPINKHSGNYICAQSLFEKRKPFSNCFGCINPGVRNMLRKYLYLYMCLTIKNTICEAHIIGVWYGVTLPPWQLRSSKQKILDIKTPPILIPEPSIDLSPFRICHHPSSLLWGGRKRWKEHQIMGCIFLIAEEQVMTDIKVTLIRPSSDIRKCPKPFETFIDRDGGETEIHFFPCDIKIWMPRLLTAF